MEPGAIVLSCLSFPAAGESDLDAGHPALSAAADDRISSLPPNLLSNIVSRLPIKDAARTTVLSKHWRRIWQSTPLVLDDRHLLPCAERRIVSAVSRILSSHPGPFRSVILTLGFYDFHREEMRIWPLLLSEKRVENLVWVNRPPPIDLPLPSGLLQCSDVRSLCLGFWMVPKYNASPHQPPLFPHLKDLTICHSLMDNCDLVLLLEHSPHLEMLSLVSSYGAPKRVRIQNKDHLRCVILWHSFTVELTLKHLDGLTRLILWKTTSTGDTPMAIKIDVAQKLEVLGYLDPSMHMLHIGGTRIEVCTKVTPGTTVPSVKILALRVPFRVQSLAMRTAAFLRCFPNVETLHIESAHTDFSKGKSFWHRLEPVECISSHVKTLIFHGYMGETNEIAFLKFIAETGKTLQKLVILLSSQCPLSTEAALADVNAALAYANWANADCELLFCTYEDSEVEYSFTFHDATDPMAKDPFFVLPNTLQQPPIRDEGPQISKNAKKRREKKKKKQLEECPLKEEEERTMLERVEVTVAAAASEPEKASSAASEPQKAFAAAAASKPQKASVAAAAVASELQKSAPTSATVLKPLKTLSATDVHMYYEDKDKRLDFIKDMGVDPYHPIGISVSVFTYKYKSLRKLRILDVTECLSGMIVNKRISSSNLCCYDLYGYGEMVQVMAEARYSELEGAEFSKYHSDVKRGDIVAICGYPGRSKSGRLTVFPRKFVVLPHQEIQSSASEHQTVAV